MLFFVLNQQPAVMMPVGPAQGPAPQAQVSDTYTSFTIEYMYGGQAIKSWSLGSHIHCVETGTLTLSAVLGLNNN